jgi:hypothetical protein
MTPDQFFTAEQQRRLRRLMGEWRKARDCGTDLPEERQAELERLVEIELLASAKRAESILARSASGPTSPESPKPA